ncbi:MAG: hypothetical protein ACREAU_01315 [Nitrosopumilaceae archaeon]
MPKTKVESAPNLDLVDFDQPIKMRRVKPINTLKEAKKPKEYKVDLFKGLLPDLNRKKLDYYNSLPEDAKKEVQPFILLRWLTGTKDAMQVVLLNEFFNPYVWSIGYKHKDLMMQLLTACTSGRQQFYSWIKYSQRKPSNIIIEVVKEYYNYSTKRAVEILPLLSGTDIINYATALGRQADELKRIKERLSKDNPENPR